VLGDLAHGGAVEALQQEEPVGNRDDLGAGARGGQFLGGGLRTVVHPAYSTGESENTQSYCVFSLSF
jgi:hypothetical protein